MIRDARQPPLIEPDCLWRPPAELPRLAGVKRLAIDVETKDPKLKELGTSSASRSEPTTAGASTYRRDTKAAATSTLVLSLVGRRSN